MPPRGEVGLYSCLSECWRVSCYVTVRDWSIQRLGSNRVAVRRNSLNLIGAVGHSEGSNGSFADAVREQHRSGGRVGEDMRPKYRRAIAHHHSAGNTSRGKICRTFRVQARDCRDIVVAQCAFHRRSKWEHRGLNDGRVVETEEVSNLMRDHRLQVVASASVSAERDSGIKKDIGIEYLSGEARLAAMLVV